MIYIRIVSSIRRLEKKYYEQGLTPSETTLLEQLRIERYKMEHRSNGKDDMKENLNTMYGKDKLKKYKVTISSGEGIETTQDIYLTQEQLITVKVLEAYFDKARNYNEPHITIREYKGGK